MRKTWAANIVTVVLAATWVSGRVAGQDIPLELPDFPGAGVVEAGQPSLQAVASHTHVARGQTFHVAADVVIPDGWVYYSPDPGPNVMAGEVVVDAPGLKVGQVLWPRDKAKRDEVGGVQNVYTSRAIVYVPLTVPAGATAETFDITLTLGGQVCQDVCKNVRGVAAVATMSLAQAAMADPQWAGDSAIAGGLAAAMVPERLKDARGGKKQTTQVITAVNAQDYTLWTGLGIAVLAGLTLNIMPCVLPVIPLRILSIVRMAGESRRRFVTLGLAFAGGIFLFFVGVAVLNIILRQATSHTLNFSEHFQYREFRIVMAMIVIALAANLFGAFNITVPGRLAASEGGKQPGHLSSLGMGVMMAVLATPCSFAFLAGALAWAQGQTIALGTVVILLIGLGMAVPHALLCAFPKLVDKLPRPGRWMELFKQSMGFVLLPVALWLLATLGTDTYPFWVAGFGVALAFGLWIWGTWVRFDASLPRKIVIRGLAVVMVVLVGCVALPLPEQAGHVQFVPFDAARIAAARKEGQTVVLKFTATWCTKCKVLEYRVYRTEPLAEAFRQRGVLAMKGDVTDHGTPAAELLRERYGGAPPVTVVYPPGDKPEIVLIGSFTTSDLIAALDAAAGT